MSLKAVQNTVAGHMDDIKTMFKSGAKVTVTVRFPDYPERDFVMTDDEPDAVIAMLERRKAAADG